MQATDFEYDGRMLSDYGFILCSFDNQNGVQEATAGSEITFDTVSREHGRINSLAEIKFEKCIEATFDICKDPEITDVKDMEIKIDELRDLMRWLNRNKFLKFRVFYSEEDTDNVFYNASFNVSKINIGDKLFGLRLKMTTDKPFGYGDEKKLTFTFSRNDATQGYTKIIRCYSDEIGEVYPKIKIKLGSLSAQKTGFDLTIKNTTLGVEMKILSCSTDEEIIIDKDSMLMTSSTGRNLWDCFNYQFFKIANDLNDGKENVFSVSLPCTIEIRYTPVIKVTL